MKKYYSPTPKIWRKIGDSLLIFSVAVTGFMASLPIQENHKAWLMFSINILGVLGKMLTNFAGEETT